MSLAHLHLRQARLPTFLLISFHIRRSTDTVSSKPKSVTVKEKVNVFLEVFSNFDDFIWPLQLIDLNDKEQFRVLYPLLYKLPHSVMHYLNELVFPEVCNHKSFYWDHYFHISQVLAHQGLKLSTCGQELGGDILFGRRIGFSGTPSDILPLELGSCNYERGSDGRVVHYLTSTNVVQHVNISSGWNVQSLLEYIATVSFCSVLMNRSIHSLLGKTCVSRTYRHRGTYYGHE